MTNGTTVKISNNAAASERTRLVDGDDEDGSTPTSNEGILSRLAGFLSAFYRDNEFVVQIVSAILLAKAYPPIGAVYLKPELSSEWIAVVLMFVLAGMGLEIEELSQAMQRFRFNLYVQFFNFGVVSTIVFSVSRVLVRLGMISPLLGDGLVVCSCLPITITIVLVLTRTAGGDQAVAIVNAVVGNLLGVFLSPVLILGYLGVMGDVSLPEVFAKLTIRVVAPLCLGTLLRSCFPKLKAYQSRNISTFKRTQQLALVFIIYCVFCKTFSKRIADVGIGDVLLMIVVQCTLLVLVKLLAWWSLGVFFPNEPRLRIMGLYGCTQKTVSMGVPLISAMYAHSPAVGLYTLPLLVWHLAQLILGSYLAPKLKKWGDDEEARRSSVV